MLGQSLLGHLPCIEHERLKRVMCVEDVGVTSPVRLLTTAIHQDTSAVKVELVYIITKIIITHNCILYPMCKKQKKGY